MSELHAAVGDLVARVLEQDEPVTITAEGRPLALLVPVGHAIPREDEEDPGSWASVQIGNHRIRFRPMDSEAFERSVERARREGHGRAIVATVEFVPESS